MYQKEKDIIIFGASSGGMKVAQAFSSMNIPVKYFVDNESRKWGNKIEEKEICSPISLENGKQEFQIIIASEYQNEIEEQLKSMNLLSNLLLKEEVIMDYVLDHLHEFPRLKNLTSLEESSENIIFDMLDGFELGGIENWSYLAALGLKKRNYNVLLYSNITEKKPVKELIDHVKPFDTDFKRYWSLIHELVESIVEQLPCTLMINKQRQLLIAGSIVKRLYPNQLKIISVLHNDRIDIYRRQEFMKNEVDKIACVSNDIKEKMVHEFGVDENKVFYKESPVHFEPVLQRSYSLDTNKSIQIGYAARLEKVQKRVDLFVPLINMLEDKRVNYQLHIAGTGSYEEKLKDYIYRNQLQNKVVMHGFLTKEKMQGFWKNSDIFLNLSDYEGVGLSMLEAMSYGCVPVVTQVAGSVEFITDGVNGYLCQTGNVDQLVSGIMKLETDRENLIKFGEICRKKIELKCSENDYIDYLEQLIV
ncbi:glycosyltransferase family 4 protein [Anaerosacchariphilus polymeriproducens]|uniref:Glycosyltransferase n=1 Tax=Anaerosacchariphilus polymeriproducens TaxID=1812858 RepID=A0A371ATD6_9FIRM|nr:glycosyltransferase family 4 protein [Anaerosacchariphilus polymeriproducens]RDU22812.1 glycosyltransferase [Anaerosacchariphilus polymeriproducens]